MNPVKSYELWYLGAAHHELLDEARRSLLVNTAMAGLCSGSVTGKQMGEKFLDMVRFDEHVTDKVSSMRLGNISMGKRHGRDIDHVHAAKSAEIRGTWDMPLISDKQLEDALFADAAREVLEQLPDPESASAIVNVAL